MAANILNLPQYRVLRVTETDHDYHVTAEPESVEMGYGLPVMERVRPMRAPEAYDPRKHEKREKNYGADISTLIRMIEAGEI